MAGAPGLSAGTAGRAGAGDCGVFSFEAACGATAPASLTVLPGTAGRAGAAGDGDVGFRTTVSSAIPTLLLTGVFPTVALADASVPDRLAPEKETLPFKPSTTLSGNSGTRLRSRNERKGPFCRRYSTMALARVSPMPYSESSSSTLAVLTLTLA